MLKENSTIFKLFIVVLDIFILLIAFWLAYRLRLVWNVNNLPVFPLNRYVNILYVSIPVTIVMLFRAGIYSSIWSMSLISVLFRTLIPVVGASILSAAFLFLTKAAYFSRFFFGAYVCIASFMLMAEKLILKLVQIYFARHGIGLKNVLILGEGRKLDQLVKTIKESPASGKNIKAILPMDHCVTKKLPEYLGGEIIDEVFIAFSRTRKQIVDIGKILQTIEEYGKPIKVLVNLDEVLRFSKIDFLKINELPVLVFYSKTMDPDLLLMKRLIDIAGAVAGLFFTMLVFPFIALAIKLDSPGPVIFAQERVGLNGRRFKLYKFRSMFVDAEERKKELMKINELKGPVFKISSDPRVTRVGRILRKTSLDELPQFWNVFIGDMSLVGTRPPTPEEVEEYKAWHYRRISIKPGLTGMWQVSGRNRVKDFDKIVALDIQYIQNWSLWLDFKIICKTIYLLFVPSRAGAM